MPNLKSKNNSHSGSRRTVIYLDFETRSECDLKSVGTQKYAMDPTTDVICLVYAINDGPTKLWHRWAKDKSIPPDLLEAIQPPHSIFEAHNKLFEEAIWRYVMTPKYGWPESFIFDWSCTAARAAAMALPRALDNLGNVLNLPVQKDMEGKRVMLRLSKPRRPTKADPHSKWHESPADLKKLFSYCIDDVRAERAASQVLEELSPIETEIWQMDQRLNRRGVFIDREGVESAILLINEIESHATKELLEITCGKVQSGNELRNILDFLETENCFLPNLTAQIVTTEIASKGLSEKARRVLELRGVLSKSSVRKFKAMLDRMNADDRVRDILIYHGASTGRDAGTGLQVQNLPSGRSVTDPDMAIDIMKLRDFELFEMLYPDPLKTISGCTRGMICAPPGKVLRAVDYNAIEARVLFWLSGCELGVREYLAGVDIYKAMASDIFGIDVKDVTKDQRALGKSSVLGCGYGMGAKKFLDTCVSQGQEIDEALAQKAVKAYRSRYKEVPKFWSALEQAARSVVLTGKAQEVGLLTFEKNENNFTVKLPSGRKLFYWYPSVKSKATEFREKDSVYFFYVDSQSRKWVEGPAWGGVWCENVVQAVARDVMKYPALEAEKAGYTPAFFVHDELVTEDEENFGSLPELEAIMTTLPLWAKKLPVAVSGFEARRYRK